MSEKIVCKICKDSVDPDLAVEVDGGSFFYCLYCAERHAYKCHDCDCYRSSEDSITQIIDTGYYVCDSCIDNYSTCEDCNDTFSSGTTYIDTYDKYVCDECACHYHDCDHCGQLTHEDELTNVDGEDIDVCESCLNDHFQSCYICGMTYNIDTMSYDDLEDGYCCERCNPGSSDTYQNRNNTNRTNVQRTSYHIVKFNITPELRRIIDDPDSEV